MRQRIDQLDQLTGGFVSIHYRAVWTDKREVVSDAFLCELKRMIAAWAQETTDPKAMVEGQFEIPVSQGRTRSIAFRQAGDSAFEITINDRQPDDETVWTTLIRLVADDVGLHVLVENSMESDDLARRISIGRPRIVHDLLNAAIKPALQASALLTSPVEIPASGIHILTDLLENPERTLPVIVCTEPGGSTQWVLDECGSSDIRWGEGAPGEVRRVGVEVPEDQKR